MRSDNNQQSRANLRIQGSVAACSGAWTVRHIGDLSRRFARLRWPQGRVQLDLSAVQRLDTGGACVLQGLSRTLQAQGRDVEIRGLSAEARRIWDLVHDVAPAAAPAARPRLPNLPEALGRRVLAVVADGFRLLAFIGETGSVWQAQLLRPARVRWREVAVSLGQAGHQALAIVGLLSFLLGVVIAYQGGVQLRTYGASIFIADLVGLSVVRELAPLMTAIIVAGRTGSAYTAQIGTMQVTEEVDALRSLGISPMELLVLPKLLALVIALPLLTVYADVMGIFGGMVMANLQLDIAFFTYVDRLGAALTLESYLVGIGKAPVFAAIIATIGCYQGFRVSGSAESVGRRTTQSVVHSILAVIVVDAAFSVAFSFLGI